MGFEKVPSMVMMNMAISAIISIALPIALLIIWKKKNRNGVRLSSFVAGALTFIVFALILESFCHRFFLVKDSALSRFVNGNTWAYVLYAALAAGIFEETGRLFTFKVFMKKDRNKEAAVTYGIGHGGVEAILLVGISMISSLVLVSTLNGMGGMDAYLALVPEESRELLRGSLTALYTTPAYMYLMGGIERIGAIVLHIGLSVFVFEAAKRPGRWYFYPAAIGLHALVDVFAVLYQKGVITSAFLMEAVVLLLSAGTAVLAYLIYKKDTQDGEETPEGKKQIV